ncbi:hypothetical protein QN277_028422 [Acacia crassicarpa]|uniref:Uncharacterized protein n=1 Tax=Acacia crassicarpa TaxID=499986 RepID=A0AAE1J331_9FABA|nr:hypothetical protein QN277_028422 [Acacia crassicarpa]
MENTNNNNNIVSREKIDQMALWFGSTLSSAFFSSLERFSCVNVSTDDADCDDDDDNVFEVQNSAAAAKSTDPQVKDVSDLPV